MCIPLLLVITFKKGSAGENIVCKKVNYNECVSWGIIEEKVFIFNEESKDIYVIKDMMKDIWITVNYEKRIENIIYIINKDKSEDVSEKIMRIVDNLVKKDLLKWE